MKYILDLVLDLFGWIYARVKGIFAALFDKFLDINAFEKAIVGLSLLAFAAVVAPVGKYVIFATVFTINNPLAHYMIGITLVMLATVYIPGFITMGGRVLINLIYLISIIYLHSSGGISKAPYQLAAGYYLNIVTPLLFIVCAMVSGLFYGSSRR